VAICFKCGAAKIGALAACRSCSAFPGTNSQQAISLALSDHLSSIEQLTQYSNELRSGKRLSVPREALVRALEALKDPHLLLRLGAKPVSPGPAAPEPSRRVSQHLPPVPREIPMDVDSGHSEATWWDLSDTPLTIPSAVIPAIPPELGGASRRDLPPVPVVVPHEVDPDVSLGEPKRQKRTTTVHQSPFEILGVTTRDDRRRIVELAEEKSLELEHDVCQKARSDLTNPRIRLSVEIAWLAGVSPRRASQLLENLLNEPMAVRDESGLPTLAHLNLLAAAFELVDAQHNADNLAEFIQEVALLAEDLDAEEVLRDINEDRVVSGFPEVRALDQIETELVERKRHYRNTIRAALNRLSPTTLIQVMTDAVDESTECGEVHASELIDELVDSYEVETQGVLQKEAEGIQKLIKSIRDSADSGEAAVKPYVDRLDSVVRNWDMIAQPIQLSAKARGIDHEASCELAYEIRSLAIDLFNNHSMLTQSQRITSLLQELFAELPEVSERVGEDANALEEIFHNHKQAEARRDEWAREITYRVKVGLVFKDNLSISPEGVSWNNYQYPLSSITRVRWGGIRHSVNGIPSGVSYTIAFGDRSSEAVVQLKNENIYSTFLEKLHRAVCSRLLTEMLEQLKNGRSLCFGDALLHDDGITLVKHKFFGADERVRCTWDKVHVWSADGAFRIESRDDKKAYTSISYIDGENTHILDLAIHMAFTVAGLRRLSELLE
jgi:hypothetical protein